MAIQIRIRMEATLELKLQAYLVLLMLCHVAAVKRLPVHHHSSGVSERVLWSGTFSAGASYCFG